jgi:hypothetical protein
MKKIFILILSLILLGIAGFFVYQYFIGPRTISKNQETVLSCSDTDGKDIYTVGQTTFERDEPGESNEYEFPDTCELDSKFGSVLREGWCEGNKYKEILTTCGRGHQCADGKCN